MIDILTNRIQNHLLTKQDTLSLEIVVSHMLCMQAQDWNQHLRAIASRCWCTQEDIIQAYNDGLVVRTWTQRGTIHVVASQDVVWINRLCASKTIPWFQKRRAFLWISESTIEQAAHYVEELLHTWPQHRKTIGEYLVQKWISMQTGRLYHILCYAGTLWIIVQWPVMDWEQAFVLTSQWIHNAKEFDSDSDAVRELCLRYFTSHGPATLEDLQRWSGLGKTILKQWVIDCGKDLKSFDKGGNIYYHTLLWNKDSIQKNDRVHFLAWFDERLLWYKNRSATVHGDHLNKIDVSRNGIFKPTVMIDGETVGIWTVKNKAKASEITVVPFQPLHTTQIEFLHHAIISYQQYINKSITLIIL